MRDDEKGSAPAGTNGEGTKAAFNGRQDELATLRATLEPLFASGYELIPLNHPDALDRKGRSIGKAPAKAKWRTLPALTLDDAAGHLAIGGNVGVRLRETDLVVDVDPRHFAPGDDPLARLVKDFGLPECPTVVTGGGGFHLYLRKPAGLCVRGSLEKYPGVEFKTLGRQVVAPGSVHPETRKLYAFDPMALVGLPDTPDAPPGFLGALGVQDIASTTEAGLVSPEELELLLSALDPSAFPDNESWQPILFACHHATAGAGREEFIAWSLSVPSTGNEWEIGNRWDSLHADGKGKRVTVRTLLDAIGETAEGSAAEMRRLLYAQLDFASDPFDPADLAALLQSTTPKPKPAERLLAETDEGSEVEVELAGVICRYLVKPDGTKVCLQVGRILTPEGQLRSRKFEWFIEEWLPVGEVCSLIGDSQTGKTFIALHMALCAGNGLEAFAGRKTREATTIYISPESSRGINGRVQAWLKQNPGTNRDHFMLLPNPCFLNEPDEVEALIKETRALAALLRHVKGRELFVVVDTLSANFSGAENTDEVAAFIRACDRIAKECTATVLFVHHNGLGNDKRGRGHSSIRKNTAAELFVTKTGKNLAVIESKKEKEKETDPDAATIHVQYVLHDVDWGGMKSSMAFTQTAAPSRAAKEFPTEAEEAEESEQAKRAVERRGRKAEPFSKTQRKHAEALLFEVGETTTLHSLATDLLGRLKGSAKLEIRRAKALLREVVAASGTLHLTEDAQGHEAVALGSIAGEE